MTFALLAVVACAGAGCSEPVDPQLIRPELTITTDGECASISFQITGPSSVTSSYPQPGCTFGLVVIKSAGNSIWDGSTRTLTLKPKIVNTSSQPVQMPVRLELPVDGKIVLLPEGTSGDSLVPLNMDSTLANDRKLWLYGGTGTLQPGDSTDGHFLKFLVKAPVTKGRFWFVSTGEEILQVPAVAPDSFPTWLQDDSSYVDGIAKNALSVEFDSSATVAERAAALDSVSAVVVGGAQYFGGTNGSYIVRLPAPSIDSLFELIKVLERQPKVDVVDVIAQAKDFGRRPADDGTWSPDSWVYDPEEAGGSNWALEEIAAPLAWGCSVGDTATAVSMVDHGWTADEFSENLVGSLPAASATNHGRRTANVLAARGDNDGGMAGVMWFTKLRLYDRELGRGAQYGLADAVRKAISDGARVISVTTGPRFYADTAIQRRAAIAYRNEVRRALSRAVATGQSSFLLVVAAGNERQNADLAGVPALDSLFPNHVLVVGASRPVSGGVRHRWGYQGSARGDNAGSNVGALVHVYAPGDSVGIWEGTGGGGNFLFWEGTSYAAAAVAGIAGLVWSHDPSLNPQQVKAHIISGAEIGGRAVQEHAGRYVANAYESLKLASNKSGTPVCGKPVRSVRVNNADRIVIQRTATTADTLVPSITSLGSHRMISVAQGGRQIATTGYQFVDNNWGSSLQYTDIFRLGAGGTWTRDSVPGAFMAVFLERDTAYLRSTLVPGGGGVGREDLWVRIGSTEHKVTEDAPTGAIFGVWTFERPSVSPTGEWVLFRWLHAASCGTDPNGVPTNYDHFTLYAASMSSGNLTTVNQSTIDWCAHTTVPAGTLLGGATAWRADARGFIEVREAEPSSSSVAADEVLRPYTASGSSFTIGSPVTVAATKPYGIYWEADGTRVRVAEEPNGQACRVAIRGMANLATVIQTLTGCDYHPAIGPSYVVGMDRASTTAALAAPAAPGAIPARYAEWASTFIRQMSQPR